MEDSNGSAINVLSMDEQKSFRRIYDTILELGGNKLTAQFFKKIGMERTLNFLIANMDFCLSRQQHGTEKTTIFMTPADTEAFKSIVVWNNRRNFLKHSVAKVAAVSLGIGIPHKIIRNGNMAPLEDQLNESMLVVGVISGATTEVIYIDHGAVQLLKHKMNRMFQWLLDRLGTEQIDTIYKNLEPCFNELKDQYLQQPQITK